MQKTFLIVACLVLATSATELLPEPEDVKSLLEGISAPKSDCNMCLEEIQFAVENCATENVTQAQCIEDWLGAGSDCLICACEILDIISGDPEICVDDNPGLCFQCIEDIQIAVDHCNDAGTPTMVCVENSLAAAAECLHCICVIMDQIAGGDGICPTKEANEVSIVKEEETYVDPLGVLDCIRCQNEVGEAIDICAQNETNLWECIEYYLVAGSDCLVCVCELAGPIFGVDIDVCNPDEPTTPKPVWDCRECVDDVIFAVEDCSNAGTSTLECVEDWFGAVSDCIICICDIIAIIDGDPLSGCEEPEEPEKMIGNVARMIEGHGRMIGK